MKWVITEADKGAAAKLADHGGLPLLVATLMVNRGITDPDDARTFLACDLATLSDPSVFEQMERAVARIRVAISRGEKIVVYGDYDVDGVTGAALLYLTLKNLNAAVDCYIPDRLTEGYGLNVNALESIQAQGAGLIISVDCGITAYRQAEQARALGIDLIITDHHEFEQKSRAGGFPSSSASSGPNNPYSSNRVNGSRISGDIDLPQAHAVLHPALVSSDALPALRGSVGTLTGVGMAFKLAQALLNVDTGDERLATYLDLVTLGTVADVGRITGENRVLVKHGLDRLSSDSNWQRPGISAFKEILGLHSKKIGVGIIGFILAPRINASGRLQGADTAFRLLTTDSREEAMALATALDDVNRERQSVEEVIWQDARSLCRQKDMAAVGALVLASEKWHPGVIGIVASRIVEEFYRPSALISVANGIGKGSARSIPGFDLYEGLAACSDLLMGFGGHKYAAGFTIAQSNIPRLQERLSSLVREKLGPDGFVRTLTVDCGVMLRDITIELMQHIERLAPFGQGNPEPRFGARGLDVVSSRIVGNKHLKLKVRQQDGAVLDAIAFNRGDLLGSQVKDGARIAAVFTPRINTWNGRTAVELEIKDVKPDK